MLSTSNVAVQFGAKPLFEQVTVKFSDGNRYGLIGANGSGKSTLMKVLGGDLDASAGDVMLQVGMRLGKLNQNQFGGTIGMPIKKDKLFYFVNGEFVRRMVGRARMGSRRWRRVSLPWRAAAIA